MPSMKWSPSRWSIMERFSLNTHPKGRLQLIFSGLILGYSIIIRPTSLFFLAILAGYYILDSHQRTGSYRTSRSLLIVVGGLIPIGIVVLYYSAIPDGL